MRCCLLFLVLLALPAAAQPAAPDAPAPDADDRWRILSPRPNTAVPSGRAFIAATLEQGTLASFTLLLDGRDLTAEARRQGNTVSLLYPQPLARGLHQIELRAATKEGGALQPLRWSFVVGETQDVAQLTEAGVLATPRAFSFSGNLIAQSRGASLSGSGAGLRRTPPNTSTLHFTGRGQYKGLTFPVKVYLTNETSRFAQRRNRVLVGMESRWLDVYAGDVRPNLDKLILFGTNAYGFSGTLKLGWLHLSYIDASLRRGVEGEATVLDPGNPDSLQITPGTYQRRLQAARLAFGPARLARLGLTVQKIRDDIQSIRYGGDPMDNLVVGSDLSIRIQRLLELRGGAAFSLTTADISNGPLTKHEIDSLFEDVEAPIDPAQFKDLIILNASTFPLTLEGLPSLAWYGEGQLRLATNTLRVEYRSIGQAYLSLANPFMPNDRRGLTVQDRLTLFQRKVSLSARFQQYQDNLSDAAVVTRTTTSVSTQTMLSLHPKWPRLTLGYRHHQRQSDRDAEGARTTNDLVATYSVGVNYSLRTGRYRHSLSLHGLHADRTDHVRPEYGSISQSLMVGLTETLPVPVTVRLQYTHRRVMTRGAVSLPSQQGLTAEVTHRLPGNRFRWTVRGGLTRMTATSFGGASQRHHAELGASYRFQNRFPVELRLGYSGYTEDGNSANHYTEMYFMITTRYNFGV